MVVAYSFKQRFVAPILARTKKQTIRADRKRHAREGESVQLYTGMRTKYCRLILRAACVGIEPVTLILGPVGIVRVGDRPFPGSLDDFARADGFNKWDDLVYFWELNHPDTPIFSGVLIRWDDGADA